MLKPSVTRKMVSPGRSRRAGDGQHLAAVGQHRPPLRGRRLDAEPEERGRREDHRLADLERPVDDHRRDAVRQDVEDQRPWPAPSIRAASTNACSFSERTEARISRANDGTPTTVIASIAFEIDGPSVATIASASKTAREGEDDVQAAHQQVVQAAAVEAAGQPDRDAERGGEQHRRHTDDKRDLAAPDHSAQHIAQAVGAER